MILTVWQVLGMFNECDRTINLQSSKGGRAYSGVPAELRDTLGDDALNSGVTCFSALPDGTMIIEYREVWK